jgi:16S rRNA (adenine1518-N6/adenine1519-N6)-dimethyltransferase
MPSLAEITRELLKSYNRYPRKNLGQHFLIDPMVLERIIAAADLNSTDLVIEIGSGLGVVTSEIAKKSGRVIGIEIDKELISMSKSILTPLTNIEFIAADILDANLSEIARGKEYKIIGNLPYYITAPIVEKIVKAEEKPAIAVIMVQKEVAERMTATPGTKKFGSFSIFAQYYAEVTLNSYVSKSSFLPWPNVGSAVVVLKPYKTPKYEVKNEKLFFDIVHAAFQQRRKTLRNSLSEFNLLGIDLDMGRRPETLTIEEFVKLANYL